MKFIVSADTDIGTFKNTNQDSVLVKHALIDDKEVLMAIICDGMGGLAKGELASATVIRAFKKWFEEELPYELGDKNLKVIGGKWEFLLKDLNLKIFEYGKKSGYDLGTTFSGILCLEDEYVIVHVGDTRVYQIGNSLNQLTTDQTFIAREIRCGRMTIEQAKTDKRRNMLLQCIGASKVVEPQIIYGTVEKGGYMICSDGFRHEITEEEIFEALNVKKLTNEEVMSQKIRELINQVKMRNERDNISVILMKVE